MNASVGSGFRLGPIGTSSKVALGRHVGPQHTPHLAGRHVSVRLCRRAAPLPFRQGTLYVMWLQSCLDWVDQGPLLREFDFCWGHVHTKGDWRPKDGDAML
jgi:hypothetical protein